MMKFFYIVLSILLFCFSFESLNANSTSKNNVVVNNSNMDVNSSDIDCEPKFSLVIENSILFIKYPKPIELTKAEVVVYNLLGKELCRKKLEAISVNQVAIPTKNTCYIIRIYYSNKVYTQKVIVTKEK